MRVTAPQQRHPASQTVQGSIRQKLRRGNDHGFCYQVDTTTHRWAITDMVAAESRHQLIATHL
jgi:hypothetical protein